MVKREAAGGEAEQKRTNVTEDKADDRNLGVGTRKRATGTVGGKGKVRGRIKKTKAMKGQKGGGRKREESGR